MKEGVIIRRMIKADIEHISQAFIHQGWPGREDILASYFQDQENGKRDILVACLLYTSPSPRDRSLSRMPSSA